MAQAKPNPWTMDADGNYVNWLEEPYSTPDSGIKRLVLPGENPHQLGPEIRLKRISEYYRLRKQKERKTAGGQVELL